MHTASRAHAHNERTPMQPDADGPQVLVGYALGASAALAWHELGVRHALRVVSERPELAVVLYALTGVAMSLFGVKNVMAWAKERQRQGGSGGTGKVATA